MEIIEVLEGEHAALRRRMDELEKTLGPEREVGWSDDSDCDIKAFRASAKDFLAELLEHEKHEEKGLGEIWAMRGGRPEFDRALAQSHRTLNCLTGLLRSAAECCDGRHVYSVRTIVFRLREALEAHLSYEESAVFPLIRRPRGRRRDSD